MRLAIRYLYRTPDRTSQYRALPQAPPPDRADITVKSLCKSWRSWKVVLSQIKCFVHFFLNKGIEWHFVSTAIVNLVEINVDLYIASHCLFIVLICLACDGSCSFVFSFYPRETWGLVITVYLISFSLFLLSIFMTSQSNYESCTQGFYVTVQILKSSFFIPFWWTNLDCSDYNFAIPSSINPKHDPQTQ